MKKRMLKKLMSLTVAAVMMAGLCMPVFAEGSSMLNHTESCTKADNSDVSVNAYDQNESYHWATCNECNAYGYVSHNYVDIFGGHQKQCQNGCGRLKTATAHENDGEWYYFNNCGTEGHVRKCSLCGEFMIDDTFGTHDTSDNGKCSVCGFDPAGCGSPSSSSENKKEEVKADPVEVAVKAYEEKVAVEEALPVDSFTSASALASVPVEVTNVGVTTSAPLNNLSAVVTTKGFIAAVNKISASTPATKEMVVYQKNYVPFNNDTLTTISKSGKDFVYMFTYKGHLYSVTIPAGANLSGVIREGSFAGPLYLGSVLGTTKVIK